MLKGRSLMNLHELRNDGYGYRKIAEITGLSRNTVRKYLRDDGGTECSTRISRPSKLDPFREYVEKRVSEGLTSAPQMMREIVPLGYMGKETTLRNYIRAIKPKRTHLKMPKQRFETGPGEQLQFDWGSFSYTDDHGKERHIAGLACVLGYSRRLYVRFAHSADIYGLIECLIKAFSHFGGVTNAVLTDHMKTVVISGDEHSGYVYNPKMEDFARYLGISIKLARVRRPETKGKVERSIRTIKEGFWPGRTFTSLADLNGQALSWCDQYDNSLHRSIGMTPMQAFATESSHLRQLPPPWVTDRFIARQRKVSLDGLVSFGGVSYQVPIGYANENILVYPRERHIEFTTNDHEVIAKHTLRFKTRSVVYLPGGYQKLSHITEIAKRSKPHGRQIPSPVVENRSLLFYQEIADA